MLHPQNTNITFHRPDVITEPLYVISPVFNPHRYRQRWKLYKQFEKHILDSGAHLVTIECTFGERAKAIVESVSERHQVIHVQTKTEAWIKENLINLAIQRLPEDWKYVAFIDADIQFIRKDWVGECLHQLQHYKFIQMFSEAHDTNSKFEVLQTHKGFMWCYKHEEDKLPPNQGFKRIPEKCIDKYVVDKGKYHYWHPGFAWACTREALDAVGGLIDWGILGGGDTFMAYALIGQLHNRNMPRSLGDAGVRMLEQWQYRAERDVRRNVGYMEGGIYHYWHGSRKDRRYNDRGIILTRSHFNPEKDIFRDWQGLWQLDPENILLRDGIRDYFGYRNEDQISD